MRLTSQPPGFRARFLQTENRWVSGLVSGGILARALSEFLARLRDVENVVDHLEGQPKGSTEVGDRTELRRFGVGAHRPEPDRRGEQGRGFVFVDVAQLRAVDPLAFAFEVGDLAGDQSPAAGGDGDFAKNRAQIVARPRSACAAISKAIVSSASPARTAMPSPKTL